MLKINYLGSNPEIHINYRSKRIEYAKLKFLSEIKML